MILADHQGPWASCYSYPLSMSAVRKYTCKSLLYRVRATCQNRGISLMAYICDGSYRNEVNQSFKHVVRNDGLVDSVTGL